VVLLEDEMDMDIAPRNFEEDLSNSNNPELRRVWEKIIRYKFGHDCEIFWKDDKCIQMGLGTDTVIKTSKGRRFSIETKTRKFDCLNNSNWIMEIVSHLYDREEKPRIYLRSKEGWIYSTTAEYIFHATLDKNGTDILEAIFYSLSPFKLEKYKNEFEQYKNLWLSTKYNSGQFQLTLNKLIPLEVIKKDSDDFWEWRKNGN
jgi:hypothetical protein